MQLTTFGRAWNKGTQTWLALCVMKRLPSLHFCHTLYSYVMKRLPLKNALLKKVIVMCTSALWHGLYPGDAACLPAAVAACSHSAVFRTPHFKLPHVIFHAPLPPPAGYYCTFLLASFWSEAEKKLFAAVAPVSKVRRGLARHARATYVTRCCSCCPRRSQRPWL
jgi:hypothetical protein